VENSFRATLLAFMDEWSLFAERNGVDLAKVIQAIKVRPTHSNIMFPGPGIGGYCLPKDGGLGMWAYKHILGFEDGDDVFKITPTAIDINDTRGLHVAQLTRDALRNMGRYIAHAEVLVCGASYRQDVGDTRYSGSELVVRKLTEMGAEMRVHDPYVDHWYELEAQDVYPAPGHSWSRFFRNQESLADLRVQIDLNQKCGVRGHRECASRVEIHLAVGWHADVTAYLGIRIVQVVEGDACDSEADLVVVTYPHLIRQGEQV